MGGRYTTEKNNSFFFFNCLDIGINVKESLQHESSLQWDRQREKAREREKGECEHESVVYLNMLTLSIREAGANNCQSYQARISLGEALSSGEDNDSNNSWHSLSVY